jgi:hypothetical protein
MTNAAAERSEGPAKTGSITNLAAGGDYLQIHGGPRELHGLINK